jgi:hypothetical protein
LHLGSLVLAAAVAGVFVGLGANRFAGGSCPGHDVVRYGSSCGELVSSLSWRVGILVGVATLVIGLVATGLLRTAEAMEDERRTMADELRRDPSRSAG